MNAPIQKTSSLRWANQQLQEREEVLTEEAPLEIRIDGEAFTLTMRTPGHDEELVRGFLHHEEIVSNQESLILEQTDPNRVYARLEQGSWKGLKDSKRNFFSTSSCGLCGKLEWKDQQESIQPLSQPNPFSHSDFPVLMEIMRKEQSLFQVSGGSHAASVFNTNLKLLSCREDIGRHNAVDKVIGALLEQQMLDEAMVLCISGRISYEILQKCFVSKIPFLASVSAPSSLAVELGEKMGVCILGFCRPNQATAYTCKNYLR